MRNILTCVAVTLLAGSSLTACIDPSPGKASAGEDPSPGKASAGEAPSGVSATSPRLLEANAFVERVVDGDTVVVNIDGTTEHLRLIGIDTPETVKPDSPVECFGPEAAAFTKGLLPGGVAVRVVRDVEARDDYDRLLGYIYRADDGLFVNLEIIRSGYASLLTFPPNVAHLDEFRHAADAARSADLGLWAGCAG